MPHWLKTNLGLIFFFSTTVGTPDYCRYHQITVGSHHMTASSHHFRDHQNISHPNLTCLYLKRYQSLISSPIVSYFSLREISLSFFFFFPPTPLYFRSSCLQTSRSKELLFLFFFTLPWFPLHSPFK